MNWAEWAVNLTILGVPPLSCVLGWWLWSRSDPGAAIPKWRQVSTFINLIVFTASIALGAFALLYWRDVAGTPAQPEVTRVATLLGFGLAAFGVPFAAVAKSWNRVALIACSLGLIAFYVGMFAAG